VPASELAADPDRARVETQRPVVKDAMLWYGEAKNQGFNARTTASALTSTVLDSSTTVSGAAPALAHCEWAEVLER
jgi:hypothetical protein